MITRTRYAWVHNHWVSCDMGDHHWVSCDMGDNHWVSCDMGDNHWVSCDMGDIPGRHPTGIT